MGIFTDRTGEKHKTKEGYVITITEYFHKDNCTIKFNNGRILKNTCYKNITSGRIKNPYHKSVLGVGYLGVGEYKVREGNKISVRYDAWYGMMSRCYSEKRHHQSYDGCSIHPYWHNFQNFAKWFDKNYKEGYHLDKDILIKGNKVYSSKTCVFVPRQINGLLISSNRSKTHLSSKAFEVYKNSKEAHIKQVVKSWKGKIPKKAFTTLLNYQVEA